MNQRVKQNWSPSLSFGRRIELAASEFEATNVPPINPPSMSNVTIELTDDQYRWASEAASRNGCRDVGDYFRQLVGVQRETERLISEGLQSGPPSPWTGQETRAIADRLRSRKVDD